MKKNNNTFKIKINSIRYEWDQNLEKKINEINDPNLNYIEKRCKVLAEEKTKVNKIPNQKYNILIKEIHEEWENKIQQKMKEIKDINLSSFQKRLLILSELKSTSYIKEENEGEEKSNLKKSIHSLSSGTTSSEGEDNINDDGIEVKNKSNRKKKYPVFNIDIEYFRQQNERLIFNEMKDIKNLNLNDFEKRIRVLKDKTTYTVDLKKYIKTEKIDIFKLNEEIEEEIKEKMAKIIDPNLNEYEKREKVLQELKTTTELVNNSSQIIQPDNNISLWGNSMDKTADTTNNQSSITDLEERFLNNSINSSDYKEKGAIKEFNALRSNFYIKKKLYDIPLDIEASNAITPEKYKINEKYFGFVYPNDLITYSITISGYMNPLPKDMIEINKNDKNFDIYLGLYFCGKTVELSTKNGKEKKKCSKNEFICKNCMKINKSNYHLKNNQLININGRVAKINKGKYHCFGRFLIGNNIIEECIINFSCKACKLLDSISIIYK